VIGAPDSSAAEFGGTGMVEFNGIKAVATASSAAGFGGIKTAGFDSIAPAPAWTKGIKAVAALLLLLDWWHLNS